MIQERQVAQEAERLLAESQVARSQLLVTNEASAREREYL